jgi:hypothetical protein
VPIEINVVVYECPNIHMDEYERVAPPLVIRFSSSLAFSALLQRAAATFSGSSLSGFPLP